MSSVRVLGKRSGTCTRHFHPKTRLWGRRKSLGTFDRKGTFLWKFRMKVSSDSLRPRDILGKTSEYFSATNKNRKKYRVEPLTTIFYKHFRGMITDPVFPENLSRKFVFAKISVMISDPIFWTKWVGISPDSLDRKKVGIPDALFQKIRVQIPEDLVRKIWLLKPWPTKELKSR